MLIFPQNCDYGVIIIFMLTYYSTIICPNCSYRKKEKMPKDSCLYIYKCSSCNAVLKPKQGDCCVFCSYGNINCPPIQEKLSQKNI